MGWGPHTHLHTPNGFKRQKKRQHCLRLAHIVLFYPSAHYVSVQGPFLRCVAHSPKGWSLTIPLTGRRLCSAIFVFATKVFLYLTILHCTHCFPVSLLPALPCRPLQPTYLFSWSTCLFATSFLHSIIPSGIFFNSLIPHFNHCNAHTHTLSHMSEPLLLNAVIVIVTTNSHSCFYFHPATAFLPAS